MATKKNRAGKTNGEPGAQQISFLVEPGTRLHITIDVGEKIEEGKVPLTVQIEPVRETETPAREAVPQDILPEESLLPEPALLYKEQGLASRLRSEFLALRDNLKRYDLAKLLFILALTVYLATRLVGLTRFPIYFFTDEAIQAQSIIDLRNNDYRDVNTGALFPTYFRNGSYYNLSLSVYLQWLPSLLFGKSPVATRATSVIVTLIAAVSIGIILRDIFKLKYWWTGTLLLSITPAWFLHSRTAFETAEFVAFYAGMLCAYLFYRYKSPRFLFLAIFLAALSFYSYSPAQMIVPLTALGLLASDWRYHWENRRTVLIGLALAVFLALPYVRFTISNPGTPFAHLQTLYSYWFENIPLSQKFTRYFSEFGTGLSPWYWYVPNDRDLSRHLMKGYGHIMIATLPLALFGLAQALRRLNQPSYRIILIACLVSPAAAALVQASITRALVFAVPAAILTAIGLELVLEWVENPGKKLGDLAAGPAPTFRRIVVAALIVLLGIFLAFLSKNIINFLALITLSVLLALPLSGLLSRLAQSLTNGQQPALLKTWKFSPTLLALSTFVVLAGTNFAMLTDALRNGPLWYRDYGMGGLQYGAFQIFDKIEDYVKAHPDTRIIFSPDWANGTDVVVRYLLSEPEIIEIGSVRGHITQKLPLDDHTIFIMTPEEYDLVLESERLTDIQVEEIVPYPDGSPGFYFVRLRYSQKADEIFAAEKAAREELQETTIIMDGEQVHVRFSYLDTSHQAEEMALVFDGDPFTLAKTLETNPFIIEMTFPSPRTLTGFSIIIGTAHVQVTLKCYPAPGEEPVMYSFEGQGTEEQPELSFDLPAPSQVEVLQVEVLDPNSLDNGKVHIWELKLR